MAETAEKPTAPNLRYARNCSNCLHERWLLKEKTFYCTKHSIDADEFHVCDDFELTRDQD